MNHHAQPITLEEIEAALNEPAWQTIPQHPWVLRLAVGLEPALDIKTLCEVASEDDPAGPLAAIKGLLEGLVRRHRNDSATTAALIAILGYHLPALMDQADHGASQ